MQGKKPNLSVPMISIRDLHLTLGSGASRVHVLKGMDLNIARGVSAGIVGPSGSGKSTLLMVIGGLERPDRGDILLNGQDIGTMNEDQLAAFRGRNIGIVFQSFHLIPNMTALENVAVPLELSGNTNAMKLAREELTSVGLEDRLTHYPAQLSGGEQQRVAIARALAPRPKILIADEPTGNLDDTTGQQIIDLLFDKQHEYEMTLALVTHNTALARRCNQVIHVRSGEIEQPSDKPPQKASDNIALARQS
jgi:putative ABC transport system ATP-binding protein